MSIFLNCLIVVIVVFGVGVLAGLLLAAMHHEEVKRDDEELLPIVIGEAVDDGE